MGEAALVKAQHVPGLAHQTRALSYQGVARHGKDLAALLQRRGGSDERAAFLRGLHHHGGEAQRTEQSVPHREVVALGLRPGRVLRQDDAGGGDVLIQPAVGRRIHHVRAAAQHRGGKAAGAQGALQRLAVDALGHAGHQQRPLPGQLIAQL